MTRDEYKKKYNPQIKSVIKDMGLEFDKNEHEKIIDEAYQMVLSGQKITKTDVVNTAMHKELIRSAVVSAYKRTHWVPTLACFLNLFTGALIILVYMYYTMPMCPLFSFNQIIQAATVWIVMYGTWKKHAPLWDKIAARRDIVRWLKVMPL